VKPKLMS